MRIIPIVLFFAFLLTSCSGWFFRPSGYNPPTPFRPPTRTPSIITATPADAATATPLVATATVGIDTPAVVDTSTTLPLPTDTVTLEPTALNPFQSLDVEVLGCNTSIDITHGLGEVTNAYATLSNTGNLDLINVKATLFALDEGREHPDKTVEIALLPVAQQVTIKLTVDTTYNSDTPIQIEISTDSGLFQRVGKDSCRDIGVLAPNPTTLNTPVPVIP